MAPTTSSPIRVPARSRSARSARRGPGAGTGSPAPWSAPMLSRRMLILGIETATEQVGVAIGGHEGVIATFEVARGRRHAETLTPAIEFVCRQADIELGEIGCIAVDVGPGLFTGMRVGLAAGKALAQALRVPMIGITSLDLLAFPCRHTDRVVVPVDRRPQGRGVLGDVPAGAGRRAAGQPAHGRSGRRARRRPAGARARTCCASATAPSATATRSPRATAARSPGRSHPSVGHAGAAGPRPGAARGMGAARTRSSRSTCALPTPRSTGPFARPRP